MSEPATSDRRYRTRGGITIHRADRQTAVGPAAAALVERLDRYLELAQALRSAVPDIDYVDLRYDKRVYVRPAGGAYTQ